MTSQSNNNPNDIDIPELLSDLKKGFIADIPSRLDKMESIILAMEGEDSFIEDYENLYRHAHSLKGSAGSYGLHIITSICHALEDALNEIGRKSARFHEYGTDYWLRYIDLIRLVLAEISKGGENFSAFEEELNRLQSIQPDGEHYQMHCLVIASSSLYESILTDAFAKQPIKFSFSYDGYKALGRLLTESFDLVISDYEVPLLNGKALFCALRLSDCRNRKVKTLLLTSRASEKTARFIDPDFVIMKDKNFSRNLSKVIAQISSQQNSQ